MEIPREDVSRPKRNNAQRDHGPGDALQNIKDSSITAADHNSVDPALDCPLRLAACSSVCSRLQKLDFNTSPLKNVKDVVQVLRTACQKQWVGEQHDLAHRVILNVFLPGGRSLSEPCAFLSG
jgi:hypothetical protein